MKGRPFRVTVTENLEQLEKSLQKARTVSQKERLQMLVWLKQGVVNSRSELAARCNRNPSTLNRWLVRYQQGGLSALLATRRAPGATRKIQGEAREKLKARLAQPEGCHSYGEIQQWLEHTCQLKVAYGTLYRVVRYELKAKPKVPRSRALKQDPSKLKAFQKNCFDP
jgi:transposase